MIATQQKNDMSQATEERGIVSSRLTTCEIGRDGAAIRLYFVDHANAPAFVELPVDQAQSVMMTLPRLLNTALQVRTGGTTSRYVFPVDQWTLELANSPESLLLKLRTPDGFEACFGLTPELCRKLGAALDAGFLSAMRNLQRTHQH